ncbi:1180_t:CDS:2 [Paraglomus brasilianum]|uniref:1180_t:CDS:1 n=1 Tax=Paraglomus brasilianum TaxID=144538 RepID=A0A9N9B0W7_9GLOM|nr:1180_t:CDS:2 [Paraglomus brasilianum]
MTENAVINGDTAEYFSSNPAAGTKYKSPRKVGGMKWDNDKVYKCAVPVMIDEIFQTKITKDMLRVATGSPEKAEMIASLQANNLKKKLDITIMEKCVESVCKRDNFSNDAYVEMNEREFNNAGKFLKKLFSTAEMMKHPTDKFNRGYKKKNGNYEKTIYASGKLKNIIVILDTDKKTDLRMEGSRTYNYSLVDLEREFKNVYDTILPKGVGALIMVGGPISFANMAIIVNKGKEDISDGLEDVVNEDEEGENTEYYSGEEKIDKYLNRLKQILKLNGFDASLLKPKLKQMLEDVKPTSSSGSTVLGRFKSIMEKFADEEFIDEVK